MQSWLLKWLKKEFVFTRMAVPHNPCHFETGPSPRNPFPSSCPNDAWTMMHGTRAPKCKALWWRHVTSVLLQQLRGASDERPTQEIETASAETARARAVTCASHTTAVSPHSCRLAGQRKMRFLQPPHRRQWRCRCCCLPGAMSAVRHWVRGRCPASGVPRL